MDTSTHNDLRECLQYLRVHLERKRLARCNLSTSEAKAISTDQQFFFFFCNIEVSK